MIYTRKSVTIYNLFRSGKMKAVVYVTLKPSVLDPQGKAIHHSVELLGHRNIGDIQAG